MMRRVLAGVTMLLALGGLGGAYTAANRIPATSVAGYTAVSVSGATMTGISYTIAANTITAFTVNFKGSVLLKTVSALFGTGPAGACVLGAYDATADTTSANCTGFTQAANRSWKLAITVS